MTMDISNAGEELLDMDEGIRTASYQDEGGNWTIGVGHLITGTFDPVLLHVTGISSIDPSNLTLTDDQVNQVLYIDLRSRVQEINVLLTRNVTQTQFDAIVDFVFNMGIGTFKNGVPSQDKESLLVAINDATDTQSIIDVIYQYSTYQGAFCDGRLKRRFIEACLIAYPDVPECPDGLSAKSHMDAIYELKKYSEAIV